MSRKNGKVGRRMEKFEIYKGLKCCSEFLCGECPYQIYDSDHYKLRCIHKLIVDLNNIIGVD